MHQSPYPQNNFKSPQQQTLMQSFISTITSSPFEDRQFINESLFQMDKTLSKLYARQHYDPQMVEKQTVKNKPKLEKLKLPKTNSLTDALIRNTLGCDEKYVKQYTGLIDQASEQKERENQIETIKNSFISSNKYTDTFANSKPFSPSFSMRHPTLKPVVDNEHQSYLKTQLIFLQKPKNKNITQKQYYQKYYDTITRKIEQLGGIEDTLSKMQTTLKTNQMTCVKNRQILLSRSASQDRHKNQSRKLLQSKTPNLSRIISQKPVWIQKSRIMRRQMVRKLNHQ